MNQIIKLLIEIGPIVAQGLPARQQAAPRIAAEYGVTLAELLGNRAQRALELFSHGRTLTTKGELLIEQGTAETTMLLQVLHQRQQHHADFDHTPRTPQARTAGL